MKKLDIVLPVLNEENILNKNVGILYKFLQNNLSSLNWKIIITDNGSVDLTQRFGEKLAKENIEIEYLRLEERGRGRALKHSWGNSKADLVSYMDIDLSTNLSHFPELVMSILYEDYDLAIGSRLLNNSQVQGRTFFREIRIFSSEAVKNSF